MLQQTWSHSLFWKLTHICQFLVKSGQSYLQSHWKDSWVYCFVRYASSNLCYWYHVAQYYLSHLDRCSLLFEEEGPCRYWQSAVAQKRVRNGRIASSRLTAGRWSHCVVSLSRTLYPLLSTGSTWQDTSWHDWKTVDWDVKSQFKQNIWILSCSQNKTKRITSSKTYGYCLVLKRRPRRINSGKP